MLPKDWKQQAEKLYFEDNKTIVKISSIMGISKVSISKHLNSLPRYKAEKASRKEQNKDRSKYYIEYKRTSRFNNRYNVVTAGTIKREHEVAVKILSSERFF